MWLALPRMVYLILDTGYLDLGIMRFGDSGVLVKTHSDESRGIPGSGLFFPERSLEFCTLFRWYHFLFLKSKKTRDLTRTGVDTRFLALGTCSLFATQWFHIKLHWLMIGGPNFWCISASSSLPQVEIITKIRSNHPGSCYHINTSMLTFS